MPTPISLRTTFQKFDLNGDGEIDGKEVDAHFREVGINGGMIGDKAREQFLSKFDTNGDGKVGWSEFCQNGAALMPDGVKDRSGHVNADLVDTVFDKIAGRGVDIATKDQIASHIKASLPFAIRLTVGGQLATAGALSALKVLDADGDGRVTRSDMKAMVADINKELASLGA
jgi:hypothetical protein